MNWKQVTKHNKRATFKFKQTNNASKTGKSPEILPSANAFLSLYVLNPSGEGGGGVVPLHKIRSNNRECFFKDFFSQLTGYSF